MNKNRLVIILTAVFLIIFSSLILGADYPISYTDDLKQEVVIKKEIERIISLAPAITEVIYALDLEDKLVAVSSACDYPQKALEKPDVGRIDEPDIEKIVALEPDLVIAESVTKIEVLNNLSKLGIKNIGFKPEGINDTIKMIKDIAYLNSVQEKGNELTEKMEKEYFELKKMIKTKLKNNKRPKVFYEVWSDPLYTAGRGSFIDSLIYDAGGKNIARNAKGSWPTYSLENLLAADPEVYIASSHGQSRKLRLKNIKERKVFRELRAYKNNRVYIIEEDLVNRPSPRIIEGYKEIIRAIFPEMKLDLKIR